MTIKNTKLFKKKIILVAEEEEIIKLDDWGKQSSAQQMAIGTGLFGEERGIGNGFWSTYSCHF